MKIYNRKAFTMGIVMIGLGTLNLILDITGNTIETSGIILIVSLYIMGGAFIIRSLSLRLSKEDKIDRMDERNQLIELKSKSMSLILTQLLSFLLMLILLVLGKICTYSILIAIGTGFAATFFLSLFIEIFTYMYYDSKN